MRQTDEQEEQMKSPSRLGRRVQKLRRQRQWRKSDLADQAGIPRSTVTNLENRPQPVPKFTTLQKLAEVFGITLADLLQGI
jgi:transcriptional regulator with XRE-family HTH domain